MKNAEIYERALELLGEKIDDVTLREYELRAPYVMGGFFYENRNLDSRYREVFGHGRRKYIHSIYADLAEDFPFLKRFENAAEYYLAAILVLDDNAESGDRFYSLYIHAVTEIISEISAFSTPSIVCEALTDRT